MARYRSILAAPAAVLTAILIAIAVQANQITVTCGGRSNDESKQTYASTTSPQWDLLKRLQPGDINGGGLHLNLYSFNRFLLPKATGSQQRTLGSSNGLNVTVLDVDTGGSFQMKITKFKRGKYYILSGGWTFEFVQRRTLRINDLVGLKWSGSTIHFGKLDQSRFGNRNQNQNRDVERKIV